MYVNAIENEQLSGIFNAVAPNPVSNEALTVALAGNLKGRFYIPVHVPEFVLKLMMGERSTEVLKSTIVSCDKILQTGFTFLYPTIDQAMSQLAKQ
jgi:NAD dependent epimerase/dehydratase family enzyme